MADYEDLAKLLAEFPPERNPAHPPEWWNRGVRNVAGGVGSALAEALMFPGKYARGETGYTPGQMASEQPAATQWAPEMALNMFGTGTPFAQAGAAGIFGGRLAKTADQAALARAEDMAAKGAPREQIWNDTGWFKGADDKWRFEIDDSGATFHRSTMHPTEYRIGSNTIVADTGTASSALRHPEAFDAYPQFNFMPVVQGRGDFKGQYSPPLREGDTGSVALNFDQLTSPPQMRSTMLHELQHAIQGVEGFAPGGNHQYAGTIKNPDFERYRSAVKTDPDLRRYNEIYNSPEYRAEIDRQNQIWSSEYQPRLEVIYKKGREYEPGDADSLFAEFYKYKAGKFPLDEEMTALFQNLRSRGVSTIEPPEMLSGHDLYSRLAGEVEARNVQERQLMSASERKAKFPWLTEDTPYNKQIVKSR